VPHAHQLRDEDEYKAMRVACYLICAMSVTGSGSICFTTELTEGPSKRGANNEAK
jgi:hypothetical protein